MENSASFNYKIPGDTLKEDIINSAQGKTTWQKIYLHLKRQGFDVYSIGQKEDICEKSYIVIKEKGIFATNGNVAGYALFDIIIYHPKDHYSTMEFYIKDVKKALKEFKNITFSGSQTPIILDEKLAAYTTRIQYKQFKRLR